MIGTINLHRIISIHLTRVEHRDFVMHEFTFVDEDGARVEILAFADEALPISESEREAITKGVKS